MSLEYGTILGLISAFIAAVVGYGKLQNQVEALKDENEKLWDQLGKNRAWAQEHERDSSRVRLEIEREHGRLRESISSKDGKLDEVIRRLGVIDGKLDKIETREERN